MRNVEQSPEQGLAVTSVTGSQIQRKLGPFIDTFLASMAGTLRRRGATEDEIRECLLIFNNSRCDPPLADDEVADVARKIARYEPAAAASAAAARTTLLRRGRHRTVIVRRECEVG